MNHIPRGEAIALNRSPKPVGHTHMLKPRPPPYAEALDESRGASETSSKRGLPNDTQCGVLPGSPRGPGEPCQPAGVRPLHPDTGEEGVGMGQPLA